MKKCCQTKYKENVSKDICNLSKNMIEHWNIVIKNKYRNQCKVGGMKCEISLKSQERDDLSMRSKKQKIIHSIFEIHENQMMKRNSEGSFYSAESISRKRKRTKVNDGSYEPCKRKYQKSDILLIKK